MTCVIFPAPVFERARNGAPSVIYGNDDCCPIEQPAGTIHATESKPEAIAVFIEDNLIYSSSGMR